MGGDQFSVGTHKYWDLLSDEQKFARVELIMASADLV